MSTNDIAAIGYATALMAFLVLTIQVLTHCKDSRRHRLVAIASVSSALWAGVLAANLTGISVSRVLVLAAELLRNVAWLTVGLSILRDVDELGTIRRFGSRYGFAILAVSVSPLLYSYLASGGSWALPSVVILGVLFSVPMLSIAEQVLRRASADDRSGFSYFCIGIVGIFAFEFGLCVQTIVGGSPNPEFWAARGYVNGLFVVLLSLGAKRELTLPFDSQYPNRIVFYTFSLGVVAVYLALAVVGYHFVKIYAGTWGEVAGIVLIAASFVAAAVLTISPTIRAWFRVSVRKTFLPYKYDYRREWLRFIATLSESGLENVQSTAIRAVAQIVNSPGGALWIQEQDENTYLPTGSWRFAIPVAANISKQSPLIRFLESRQWVIDLMEFRAQPSRYGDLQIEDLFLNQRDWWLIVPLLQGPKLFGFIVLRKPKVVPPLNFEDHDLLRTVGRQVGTHINQAETDRRLAESSQFGTYDRLTAFLMHDLNNLIAQQSLVVKNAEKYRHNPEFVDDAISTIANSVARMKRLMEQLTSGSKVRNSQNVDLRKVLRNAVKGSSPRQPEPTLTAEEKIVVRADPERLCTVIEHLIRNAQDATDKTGSVRIVATCSNDVASVSIQDTGCGMSMEFIRERLFRPFDSTKGSQSMGIGAYQAREYVRSLGGQVTVLSEVGRGTTFNLSLPAIKDSVT